MSNVAATAPTKPRRGGVRRALVAVLATGLLGCSGGDDPAEPEVARPPAEPRTDGPAAIFVEADAEGGDGSADAPFGTLREGLEALRPGDSLTVGGGTYEERLRDLDIEPGTEDAPITVAAAAGERVVLEGLLWLEEPSFWSIEGINVTWSDDNRKDEHMVKLTGGERWSFTDAEVWDARSYAAILVAGEPVDFVLRDLYVHDTHESNGGNQDHLVYLNSGQGGGVVERCLLVGSPNGRAVKIGPGDDDGDRVSNLVIRYNTMVDNRGPSNVQLAWKSSDNVIERNIMVTSGERRESVTTFELDGDGNVVRDNLWWDSTGIVDDEDLDGGGNVELDPRLDDEYVPREREALAFGHLADATP